MYYFSKLEKEEEDGDVMRFRHMVFRRGNQECFYQIGRRNKTRDQILSGIDKNYSQTLKILEKEPRIPEQTKSLLRMAIEYHTITLKNLKKIKGAVDDLSEQMKTVRSKELKSSLTRLRDESMGGLGRLVEEYRGMDGFIREILCRDFVPLGANHNPNIAQPQVPTQSTNFNQPLNMTTPANLIPTYSCPAPDNTLQHPNLYPNPNPNPNPYQFQLQHSYQSHPFLLDQPRTIKDMEYGKVFNLQSENSLILFKSQCSLEKNFKDAEQGEHGEQGENGQGHGREDEEISLGQDLKEEEEEL